MKRRKIILATKFSCHSKAFFNLGIPFVSEDGVDMDRFFSDEEKNPEEFVKKIARIRAEKVAERQNNPSIVIGLESVIWFQRKILYNPKSKEEAFLRLKIMSGKDYWLFAGIAISNFPGGDFFSCSEKTYVVLRDYSEEEIVKYLDQDKEDDYLSYAQGFNPLVGCGNTFIKRIEGNYNGIIHSTPIELIGDIIKKNFSPNFS